MLMREEADTLAISASRDAISPATSAAISAISANEMTAQAAESPSVP